MRNIFEVKDGRITGRNGHFDMPKVQVLTGVGLTYIDGIGKSGNVLNAGLSMATDDFEQGFVKSLPDHVLIQELRARNYALAVWSVEDVLIRAEDRDLTVTQEQAECVIGMLDSKQDCNYGITWDTLDIYIDEIFEEWED